MLNSIYNELSGAYLQICKYANMQEKLNLIQFKYSFNSNRISYIWSYLVNIKSLVSLLVLLKENIHI